jgi:tRNA threonylcarbamoyladenosine biosynthesis protein TsaE
LPLNLNLPDEAATQALGASLARGIAPGLVLHLAGDLGSGKTTLARGLLRALGYQGRVKSPTYTLVEPYPLSRLHLYHFDFYRLKEPGEWLNSGFRDYFGGAAACVVEWPERAGDTLPAPDLRVQLDFLGSGRSATLTANSAAGEAWLRSSSLFRP